MNKNWEWFKESLKDYTDEKLQSYIDLLNGFNDKSLAEISLLKLFTDEQEKRKNGIMKIIKYLRIMY